MNCAGLFTFLENRGRTPVNLPGKSYICETTRGVETVRVAPTGSVRTKQDSYGDNYVEKKDDTIHSLKGIHRILAGPYYTQEEINSAAPDAMARARKWDKTGEWAGETPKEEKKIKWVS